MPVKQRREALLIPKTDSEVTPEWIFNATGFPAKIGTITVTGNIQEGLGYLSNLCRVAFISEDTGAKQSFLMKLPPRSSIHMEFALEQKVDQKEIEFYSNVMPQLLKISPELKNNLCEYYSSKIMEPAGGQDYNSVLLFEDLKNLGYQNLNTESPHWKENLEQIMTFCAKFHAASLSLENMTKTKLSQIFPFCMGAEENENLKYWLDTGIQSFSQLEGLLREQNCSENVIKAYSDLSSDWEQILTSTISKGRQFPCLIHGDLWWSNIMINENEPRAPVKIIDWQILSYRDPSYDIIVAILLGLPVAHCNKKSVDYFAKYYFKEFLAACKAHGRKYAARNEQDFINFFNTWGMGFGYIWLLLTLLIFKKEQEKELLKTALELLQNEYKTPEFLLRECSKF